MYKRQVYDWQIQLGKLIDDQLVDFGLPSSLQATRGKLKPCLLYTSDAADERSSVDLGGRRIIKKKKHHTDVGGMMIKKKTK